MFLLLELWDDEERMVRTHWCMINDMFVLELQLITSLQEYIFLFYISNIALWFIAAGKATAIGGVFSLHSMLFSILHASVVRDQPREHICSGCSIMPGTWTHQYQHSASEQSPDPPIAVTQGTRAGAFQYTLISSPIHCSTYMKYFFCVQDSQYTLRTANM